MLWLNLEYPYKVLLQLGLNYKLLIRLGGQELFHSLNLQTRYFDFAYWLLTCDRRTDFDFYHDHKNIKMQNLLYY